jgi:hypothetical protein
VYPSELHILDQLTQGVLVDGSFVEFSLDNRSDRVKQVNFCKPKDCFVEVGDFMDFRGWWVYFDLATGAYREKQHHTFNVSIIIILLFLVVVVVVVVV